jgi:hypothetical protein
MRHAVAGWLAGQVSIAQLVAAAIAPESVANQYQYHSSLQTAAVVH